MKKDDLLDSLRKRVTMTKWSKLKKLANIPLKVVRNRWAKHFNRADIVTTKMFWGGKMKVVLPEIVSTHIFSYGFFDEEVCYYIIHSVEEGDTFIDIGSHFGSFSLLASKIVGSNGKVISFDPTPSTYQLMSENLESFALYKNFQTFNMALFDRQQKISFYDFGLKESAYNSILGSRTREIINPEKYMIEIDATTLDIFTANLNRIDFIKIDAESAELAILKGGIETLKKFYPKLVVEIGDTGLSNAPKSIEIISFLLNLGYSVFQFHNGTIVPHSILKSYDKNSLSCYNLLFVKAQTINFFTL